MLSLGKLAPGQQQYYLDTVARGAEEYYTGAKEAPGEWHGAASVRLGLSGEVDADKLAAVLAHQHPRKGEALTRSRSHPQVAGFDATFSAPKSVSLLFALGDPETSNQVRNAHDTAVNAALGALEDHASVGRRGRGGLTNVGGDGFVAAGFRHRTSRAAEPQLHTHVVIANLVHSPVDGRWTALDARPLYRWSRPVGFLYEAQLRWELTRRLGVACGPVHNGIADVAHIPTAAIEAFSTRRRQIVEHLTLHGESGGRAAQIAAYATRTVKDPDATPENLVDAWRAKATAHGLDDRVLAAALHRQELQAPPAPGSPAAEALFVRLAAPDGLTARRSTFNRAQVLEAICDRLPGGGRVLDIIALGDAFLASDNVIPIGPPKPDTDATDRSLRAVEDLNDRARQLLQRERQLNPDMVRIGRRSFTVRDVVLALRNDYRLDVLNGTRGIIERIDSKEREMQVLTDDGRRLAIPFDYAAAGNLTHGYATTIHKAQGATVDRCFVLVEEATTREHAYTALSRGRHGNGLYVTAPQREGDELHSPEVEPDQLDRLRHSLSRSIRQALAVNALRPQPEPAISETAIDDGIGW